MSAAIDVHVPCAPALWLEDDLDFLGDEEVKAQILAEHKQGASPTLEIIQAMIGEGVDMDAICRRVEFGDLDPPRLDRVVYTENGFEFAEYRPDDEHVGALVFVVRNHIGDPIDLAAWSPPRPPALWHSRGCMLGEDGIFGPRMTATAALLVHASPLEWLRAACRGVVIIDPVKAASLLRRAEPLQVASIRQGLELRDWLEVPRARILVPAGV
jgi:hypothetical protein